MGLEMSIAIYPGSFDPITKGHIDILRKAAKIFDKVIIAVSVNSAKKTMFSIAERIDMIKKSLANIDNIEVDSFTGLTVQYAKEKNANAIIRGLRTVSDFEYEMQMSQMNNNLYDDIETIFLVTKIEYSFVSSSIIKEISKLGGDIDKYITPIVKKYLTDYKDRGEL